MTVVMVDVEADGPIPSDYSMISFGAVICFPIYDNNKTIYKFKSFYGKLKPISDKWIPEALSVSKLTREETLIFDDPKTVMLNFESWIKENIKDKPMFFSDNNGFDWQFINYYFWHFLNRNPFGHSSSNLGSWYKGLVKNNSKNFKHLRKTKHTHHPVDDATGNFEALLTMTNNMNFKIKI